MKNDSGLLPQVAFGILLALALKPRHGYEIMQQVEIDSGGKVRLGPGALYGSIKHLLGQGLIEETAGGNGERRRYYRLTEGGRARLSSELQYFATAVELAKQRRAFGSKLTWGQA